MRARTRDRRVYLSSHPVLFLLMAAGRRRPALRLGKTVIVHGRAEFTHALTKIPLDRTAAGTTGGAAGRLTGADALFDQTGEAHRQGRRAVSDSLGAAGVDRLRPVWMDVLNRHLKPLPEGGQVDLVPLAAELAGATAVALLGLTVDPIELAGAARSAAAEAAREHLPGFKIRRPGAAARAAAQLNALAGDGLAAILAVAAITTTVAARGRAAAWASDADLWAYADNPALADELLRVTSPTPLLPRVAAEAGTVGGCPVGPGERMLLIARHAAGAHDTDPDPVCPATAQVTQLVFGAGPHACPGARLARAQMRDLLAALAPYDPRVVKARADRCAALPSWRSLVVSARRV